MTDPTNWFATAVHILDETSGPAFFDAKCAGAAPIQPPVKIDWSISGAENHRRCFDEIDGAFAKPVQARKAA